LAIINGEGNVNSLDINGKVSGKVSTKDKIEIHSTGKLYGKMNTPTPVIQEGGLFDGTCKMDKGAEAAAKRVTSIKEKEAAGEEKLMEKALSGRGKEW